MKDWHAAAHNWMLNDKKFNLPSNAKTNNAVNHKQAKTMTSLYSDDLENKLRFPKCLAWKEAKGKELLEKISRFTRKTIT